MWTALGRLTRNDMRNLAGFAGHLLRRLHLPTSLAEDVVQNALLALAFGASGQGKGRHPRPRDLAPHVSFLSYLRGVIRSLVDGRHFPQAHCSGDVLLESDRDPYAGWNHVWTVDEEVAFRDLVELLYQRLSMRIPPRLHQLLVDWRAQCFDCNRIPLACGRHRRLRVELRALAASVLHDLINDVPAKNISDKPSH